MLHASTKATLKREFGESLIKEDIFGTIPSELSFEAYQQRLQSRLAPKPLTSYEEDLSDINAQAHRPDIGATTKHSVMKGVAFPIKEESLPNIRIFADCRYNFLILVCLIILFTGRIVILIIYNSQLILIRKLCQSNKQETSQPLKIWALNYQKAMPVSCCIATFT